MDKNHKKIYEKPVRNFHIAGEICGTTSLSLKCKNTGKSPYSVRTQENTDQKKLRIWALFMQ